MVGQREVGLLGAIDRWVDQRAEDARQLRRDTGAAARAASESARQIRDRATQQSTRVVADIGRQLRSSSPPAPRARRAPPSPHRNPPALHAVLRRAADEGLAGARGAQDAFTFGLGDRAYAGVRSILDASHGEDLGKAYARRMAVERSRDSYDAHHHGVARTVGQVLGTGAQIAATGALGGAALGAVRVAQGGVRMAQASPLIAREIAVLGAGGAAIGAGGQAVNDITQRRLSSPGDYVGAGVGGVVGALTARTGRAGHVGAAEGVTTAVTQDLLNGRRPSLERAQNAARAGATLGALGGVVGRIGSNRMSNAAKERLGEDVSLLRTWARGDKTVSVKKTRAPLLNQKYTYPDQRSNKQLIEPKFGLHAKLSDRQLEAYQQLKNYRVDATLPKDVGVAFALPAATFGILDFDRHNQRR